MREICSTFPEAAFNFDLMTRNLQGTANEPPTIYITNGKMRGRQPCVYLDNWEIQEIAKGN